MTDRIPYERPRLLDAGEVTADMKGADSGHVRKCPFCGGPARLLGRVDNSGQNDIFYVAIVRCDDCGAKVEAVDRPDMDGRSAQADAEAVKAWNRRADV